MTKKKKLTYLFIIIILLAVGIGLWVKHTQTRERTLTIGIYTGSSWDVPSGKPYHMIDYTIKKFKKEHPHTIIKYESGIRREDYRNWLSEKIIEEQMPDLVIVPSHDFNLLASEGAFKNVGPMMSRDKISSNEFYHSALEAGQYKKKQLALPYEANPTLMVMNKTLLSKLKLRSPNENWTPEKFYQTCHKVSHSNSGKKYYGVTSNYNWQDAQLAYGNQLFSKDDNKLQLTSSKAHDGFSLTENLTNDVALRNVTSQLFDEGKVAFMPLGLAQYRTYTSYPYYITRDNNFRWGCTKMPGIKGAKSTPMPTTLFAISSKAKNPGAAWQFMKLLCTDKDVQQELMKTNMGSSVLPSVVKSKKTQKILDKELIDHRNLAVKKLDVITKNGAVTPKFKDYNDKLDELDYKIQNALKAGNLENQLFNIQSQVNQSISN